ncbi:MAG: hypothetical protein ABSF69_28965 [Polyangiaceae bacterium]|jgi:hypothetical protein
MPSVVLVVYLGRRDFPRCKGEQRKKRLERLLPARHAFASSASTVREILPLGIRRYLEL